MNMQELRVENPARIIMVWKAIAGTLFLVILVLTGIMLLDSSTNSDNVREAVHDGNVARVSAVNDANRGIAITGSEELGTSEMEIILIAELSEKLNSLRPWRGGLVFTK